MVNYIVSGIERSGTSMMMQILYKGGAPVAFDDSRPPDYHNPKGYYELEGGKVISKLMEGNFPFEKYDEKFIKITAYGLKFLPEGNYKIIYMVRDIEEVMDSMEKMSGPIDREKEKPLFEKLNEFSLNLMEKRKDIDYIVVNYRDVIKNPQKEIERINQFLGGMLDVKSATQAVDPRLYRNIRE
ncbi:MAG: sulfotransferase domain-containing protein [Thermoplasmata archaeon]|nr:MAG: sulfotransferase domain-containing protein [Thermoplasmata archaeon]